MRWLTLNDSLEHITSTNSCTSVEAQRYLKAQIGAKIIPVKWSDSAGTNDIPDPAYLQSTKLCLSGTGHAHDKHAYRPLMVLHSALLTAWQNKPLKGNAELTKKFESAAPDLSEDWNDNDKSRWMTLVSAEEHIEVLQNCDSVEALRQLKEEIGDGVLRVRWADDPTGKPNVAELKVSQFILFGPGPAADGTDPRPLLLNSGDILRLWPEQRDVKKTPIESPNADSGPGRPSAREIIWKTLSEMQSQGPLETSNQSKIARNVMRMNKKTETQSGWKMRTVLQHVSDWLNENPPDDAKMRK